MHRGVLYRLRSCLLYIYWVAVISDCPLYCNKQSPCTALRPRDLLYYHKVMFVTVIEMLILVWSLFLDRLISLGLALLPLVCYHAFSWKIKLIFCLRFSVLFRLKMNVLAWLCFSTGFFKVEVSLRIECLRCAWVTIAGSRWSSPALCSLFFSSGQVLVQGRQCRRPYVRPSVVWSP